MNWLAQSDQIAVIGHAGTGKSTVLRCLALDLLGEQNHFTHVAKRWGRHLLLFISFAKWVRLTEANGGVVSIKALIRETWQQQLTANYFIRVAEALGYSITITQYRQACAGMSVCGDAINGEEWPFTWLITAPETTINYAQCGLTYCSDPLRSWGNRQLECRLTVLNPSHTVLKFGYIS